MKVKRFILGIAMSAISIGVYSQTSDSLKPVAVSVNTSALGSKVSPNMMGLSYEISLLRPDSTGKRYFSPDNEALIKLFKTIGIKSLRIGGGSLDALTLPLPTEQDVISFLNLRKRQM
jgi:hypothetical protein